MFGSIKAGFCLGNDLLVEDALPSTRIALSGDAGQPLDISTFTVHALGKLTPGTHSLTLSDRAVKLHVSPETSIHFDFACTDNADHQLSIDRVTLTFSQPLRIINILTTLDEMRVLISPEKPEESGASSAAGTAEESAISILTSHLKKGAQIAGDFIERRSAEIKKTEGFIKAGNLWKENASPYLEKIADSRGWKKLSEVAGKTSEKAAELSPVALEKTREFFSRAVELGEETFDRAIDGLNVTRLDIVTETPNSKNAKKRLLIRFTGEIIVNDKIHIPMKDLQLPGIFLSRFDPELSSLVSQFCVTSDQGTSLTRTFLCMLDVLEGGFDADFILTPFTIHFLWQTLKTCDISLAPNRLCHVQATFSTERHDHDIAFSSTMHVTDSTNAETVTARLNATTTDDALVECGQHIDSPDWTLSMIGSASDIRGRIEFLENSRIFPDALKATLSDPLIRHEVVLPLTLEPMPISGSVDFGISASNTTLYVHTLAFETDATLAWLRTNPLDIGSFHTEFDQFGGKVHLAIARTPEGMITADVDGNLRIAAQTTMERPTIPEFHLSDPKLNIAVTGDIDLSLHAKADTALAPELTLEIHDSSVKYVLDSLTLKRDIYEIDLDTPFEGKTTVLSAALNSSGLTESIAKLYWSMPTSPILRVHACQTAILSDEMLSGKLTVMLSEQGKLHFAEGTGYYNHDFFNALLRPERGKEKLFSLITHKPIYEMIERIIHDLADVTGPLPTLVFDRFSHWVDRCKELGVVIDLNHAISMPYLAQMVSLFLFDRLDETAEIEPLFVDLVHSRGLDRYKAESLLDRAFPSVNMSQFAPLLRIIDRIFRGIPYQAPPVSHEEAICDTVTEIGLLPSANHLFDLDIVSKEEADSLYDATKPYLIDCPVTRARIFKYAAGYNVRQLEWLLAHHAKLFSAEQCAKLKHLIAIKKRILKQETREGSFLVQDFNIDYFLQRLLDAEDKILDQVSDISGIRDPYTAQFQTNEIVECFATWLTPEDTGRLLSAGISSRIPTLLVQLNQTRLVHYLIKRGRYYTLATLYEAASGSDRILTSLLMSLLNMDLSFIKNPPDLVSVFSEILDMPIPRRIDFMPGNARASESYFEKLHETAHTINTSVNAYVAAKLRMRSERIATTTSLAGKANHPKRPPYIPVSPSEDDLVEIARAIEKADVYGKEIVSLAMNDASWDESMAERVQKAYAYAWRVAASVLKKYPSAFEHKVFRDFYARTYNALIVQTLDDDLKNDVDEVRRWFEIRTGIAASAVANISRVARRKAIIDMLFYEEADRKARLSDPLTWIDTRPVPSPTDLTIIFAPGVITEGSVGQELGPAVERLEALYDIKFIRSDTGNLMPLAFNAEILEEDMRQMHSPFMLIGYSQGCANMMKAEAEMYASTPDDRAILDNLVSRHFLFSALNGSPHAIIGFELYRLSVIDGERYLKSVSAITSAGLTTFLFNLLRKFLDDPFITKALNSVEALSWRGLDDLAQNSQYTPDVISTEVQGIIQEFVPETLYYMHTMFDACGCNTLNDCQVGADCAHAYHVYHRNASVDLLRTEAIPGCTLKAHHWYPVRQEVALIESPLDLETAVYRAPTDIMLFPSIETLLLFGRIHRKS